MSGKFKRNSTKKKSRKTKVIDTTDSSPLKNDFEDNQIMNLSESEINEQFEIFLDDMEIPSEKREALRGKDTKIKVAMLKTSKTIKIPKADYYVDLLKRIISNQSVMTDVIINQNLESVLISLTNYKVSWVKEFYELPNDGLNVLIECLKVLKNKHDSLLVCLKSFRAFSNCGFGLFKIIENKEALLYIAMCLEPEQPHLMSVAVEMLTLFSFFNSKAHANVVEALYQAGKLNSYKNRFIPLIRGVEVPFTTEHDSLSLACIRFIMVLINPKFKERDNEPLKIYYSLHLRREFILYGLLDAFSKLQTLNNASTIQSLIKKFRDENQIEEASNRDEAEMDIEDFGDCDAIFAQLKATVSDTVAATSLQSILGTLLIIKCDPLRNNIFHFIDRINAEIILQNEHNFCPDPTLRAFDEISLKKIFQSDLMEENAALRSKLEEVTLNNEKQKLELNALRSKSSNNFEHNNETGFSGTNNGIHPTKSSVLDTAKRFNK